MLIGPNVVGMTAPFNLDLFRDSNSASDLQPKLPDPISLPIESLPIPIDGTEHKPNHPSFSMNLNLFRADADVGVTNGRDNSAALVRDLKGRGKSFRVIERETGIPKSTASDLINHPDASHGSIGKTPYLSEKGSSEAFKSAVTKATLDHKPPTMSEGAALAGAVMSTPGHPVHPSPKWMRNYAKRHKEQFNLLKPKPLEAARAKGDDPNILVTWHNDLEKEIHPQSIPAFLTFNMDELKPDPDSYIGKKGQSMVPVGFNDPSVVIPNATIQEHISIGLFTAADPKTCRKLRHLVIIPLQNFPENLDDLREYFDFSANPGSGWTNEYIFNCFCQAAVIQINKIREEHKLDPKAANARALLYLDADESRRTPEGLKVLKENNIVAAGLVPHSTTRTQPNDNGLIGSVQNKAAASRSLFREHEKGECW